MDGEDHTPHMTWDELKGELERYFNEMNIDVPELTSYHFHESLLSPVRHQGDETGMCAFVACISCLEMVGRLNNVVGFNDYLCLNDIFDNIFKLGPGRDVLRWNDIDGSKYGATIWQVLRYARRYGLLMDTECRNPRKRNMLSFFCREALGSGFSQFAQPGA